MKLFIVFVFAAAATAKPSGIPAAVPVAVPVAPVAVAARISTQYHSQDELGQYSYGYSNAHSAKAETRSLDGLTVGGYTYVDPAGKLQTVEYSSDVNGFRVAASNLPVAPAVPVAPVLAVPLPVQDTPEVVEARLKHLEAFEAAKVRSAEVISSVPAVPTVVQSITPVVAGFPVPSSVAVKSAIEPVAPSSEPAAEAPSTEAPSTPAAEELTTTLAPTLEAKSAILPAAGGAIVTPAGVSVLSVPTLSVKSLVAPSLLEGVSPVLPGPTAYAINSLYPYGFTSVVAQPALRAYTAQFVASVPGSVVETSQAWSPTEGAVPSSE